MRREERERLEAAKTNITIGGERYVAKQGNPYLPSKEALAAMWKEEQAAIEREQANEQTKDAPLIIWDDNMFEPVLIDGDEAMSIQAVEAPKIVESEKAPPSSVATADGRDMTGGDANAESPELYNLMHGKYETKNKGAKQTLVSKHPYVMPAYACESPFGAPVPAPKRDNIVDMLVPNPNSMVQTNAAKIGYITEAEIPQKKGINKFKRGEIMAGQPA